ncbi:hypothetical protein STXM2123_1834 [Streptomyces sp. F-3]|nr:hypothetical protein STXM2123_1834 [Streptomyces sp. F-3]
MPYGGKRGIIPLRTVRRDPAVDVRRDPAVDRTPTEHKGTR